MHSAVSAAAGSGLGSRGVGIEPNPAVAPLIPHQLFMLFQMLVAVFAAALISGAIVERVRFSSYLVFMVLWSTLVYDPVAHWVWGPDGWIKKLGALDFGGGLVVHLTSGLAALCCVRVVGKRKGLDHEDLHPHNLTLTAVGTGLLWFGWQGLNAGQARGASAGGGRGVRGDEPRRCGRDRELEHPRVPSETKGDGAGRLHRRDRRPGRREPGGRLRRAAGRVRHRLHGGAALLFRDLLKGKLGYDDSLDVFGVHGVGGLAGVLMLGFVAAPEPDRRGGRLARRQRRFATRPGNRRRWPSRSTPSSSDLVLLLVIDRLIGLRVSAEEEDLGLDLTQHGQRGYMMGEGELIGIES